MNTYTFAILEVSKETYEEIAKKLVEAGYDHAFHETEEGRVIDMHGIALKLDGGIAVGHSLDGGTIFIDGGFDPDSYEERVKRSGGRKK